MTEDIRTPSTYFQSQAQAKETYDNIRERLDDLLEYLHSLKEQKGKTPAYKKIVDDEISKVEMSKEKKERMKRAKIVVDYMIDGDESAAVDAMVEEIKYRISSRLQPQLEMTGAEMEEQIFWSEQYGHK